VGDGSVAYMAHVVGFTVGLLLTMLYIGDRRERPPLKARHM
jgi:membrane associated rhomboid family serine protease